jgi:tripartite-type tricarboxylate transporter receptor subunit TctC
VVPQYLGQALVVVNKPGAGGTVGASFAAKQRPNGYTLLAALQGPLILNPLQVKVDYSLADFEPIIHLLSTPLVLVAHPDVEWNTLQEMIQHAKDNPPGTIKFAATGFGNLPYVLTFLLENKTGTKFTVVPMKGGAPGTNAVLGHHMDAIMVDKETALPYIQEGTLKGIAVLAEKRTDDLPKVPAVGEQGFPELGKIDVWRGVVAPKGTPQPVIQKLHDAFKKSLEDKSLKTMWGKLGITIDYKNTQAFGEKMDYLSDFFSKWLKDLGLTKKK